MTMRKMTVKLQLAVCIALAVAAAPIFGASAALAATALPGGATTLTEKHDDWMVRCELAGGLVHCSAQQEQLDSKTRQRVLAIEFQPAADNLPGTLVLPFGLLLSAGATLQVDQRQASAALPFQTCLPAGCLVPLLLAKDWQGALRQGATLAIMAQAVGGQPAKFSISLKGLAGALDRIAELTK
jgi:invasion protein IalB